MADSVRIPDAGVRQDALNIRASWIVEAPAGSGKTELLIQRYLKLLGDDSVSEPEQVLAITFTVKATAEMRDRVLNKLQDAHRQTPVTDDFAKATRELASAVMVRNEALGWDLLAQPHRLHIRTIDSICSEITGTLPLLSGLGGPRDRTTAPEALYREAARQTLLQLGGSDALLNDALRTLLRHRDGNLTGCEQLIADMLSWREQWGSLIPFQQQALEDAALDSTVRPRLERALEELVCEGLGRLARAMPKSTLQALTQFAAELAHAEGYNGKVSPIAICAGLHDSPGETAEHLDHWRALIHLIIAPSSSSWRSAKGLNKNHVMFEMSSAEKTRLAAMLEELRHRDDLLVQLCAASALPPAKYPEDQWRVVKALFRILRQAMIELKLLFARQQECDYTEVALAARTALDNENGPSDYADALGMKLQHLLVDEMQDTSLGQYKLLELLTRGWDGSSQTLFLVGDPKQSIYLFRQARVERFLRTMETKLLGALPLGVLRLTANFRSQQKLVTQFNEDFSRIFSGDAPTYAGDVPYVYADAILPSTSFEGVTWHPLLPEEDDSAEICEIIRRWRGTKLPEGRKKLLNGEPEPWKIAVLVRARPHLEVLVDQFKQAAIPFRAVDVESLGQRQEVLDVFALTRALLHPADRVAWFAILRAPWCGLTLTDLHVLGGGDDFSWAHRSIESAISERGHLLSEDGCARLERIWPVLEAALDQRGRLTTAQWVERTWRSLGGDAYATPEDLANVHYYLQLLDEVEKEGPFLDLAVLQQTMHKLYAQPTAPPDAIDLMTIHGAKGLEWDIVIVPSLEKKARVSSSPLIEWVELDLPDEGAAHVLLAPVREAGRDSTALNKWVRGVRAARDAAERKRLYYVACTRARLALHLFAAPKRSDGVVSLSSDSLLKAAWPAAAEHFPISSPTEAEDTIVTAKESAPLPAPIVHRLPIEFDPSERFRKAVPLAPIQNTPTSPQSFFERPEGGFAARAFGNVVHACIETMTDELARGASREELLAALPGWTPRIQALLRGSGMPPANIAPLVPQAISALQKTLSDSVGHWLLSPHPQAKSEYALDLLTDTGGTVRLDRVFLAGPGPQTDGSDYLWIVDFKTTSPGGRDDESFFRAQQEAYRPQMETYARALQAADGQAHEIRLALYYPLAQKLLWWTYDSNDAVTD